MESLLWPCACIRTMNPIGQFHVAYATRICPSAFGGSWKGSTLSPACLRTMNPLRQFWTYVQKIRQEGSGLGCLVLHRPACTAYCLHLALALPCRHEDFSRHALRPHPDAWSGQFCACSRSAFCRRTLGGPDARVFSRNDFLAHGSTMHPG